MNQNNKRVELEMVDTYEVDSRNDTQIKKLFFNIFFDKEFYVLQLFIVTIQNQIIQINKGYCEYEETVIIDFEGEKQILDLAFIKGNIYILFEDQYTIISQEDTQFVQVQSEYNKFESVRDEQSTKVLFVGKNVISYDSVQYLFEDAEIVQIKDNIAQNNCKSLLVEQKNNETHYLLFNLETCECQRTLKLSTKNIIDIYEINSSQNIYLTMNKNKEISLITKIQFINYLQQQISKDLNYLKTTDDLYLIQQKKISQKQKQKMLTHQNQSFLKDEQHSDKLIEKQDENSFELIRNRQNTNQQLLSQEQRNMSDDQLIEQNSIQNEEQQLEEDTLTFLKCIQEYDSRQRKDLNNGDYTDLNDGTNDHLKYSNISNVFDRLKRERSNQEVIVDILKEGNFKSRVHYDKIIFQGKTVSKKDEICQICKKTIFSSNEEDQQTRQYNQANRKHIDDRVFFFTCRHSFHKLCILSFSHLSLNFKTNKCPICAEYEHLEDLPPQSYL